MGLFRLFKSIVDDETAGDEIIRAQEKAYRKALKLLPGADQHVLLAQVWLSRMAARGKSTDDGTTQAFAFNETMQFACIPPPDNVRALGLYFIYKEMPYLLQKVPKFSQEFERLMIPVHAAMESGDFDALYKKYNPNMESNEST